MKYIRIYADANGESHTEDVEVPTSRGPRGALLGQPIGASSITFRQSPPDWNQDWHNAPRRQFVITLAGEAEIVTSDGAVRRVGPGDVLLTEDVTGKGHITRGVGTAPRIALTVPLADQGPTSR